MFLIPLYDAKGQEDTNVPVWADFRRLKRNFATETTWPLDLTSETQNKTTAMDKCRSNSVYNVKFSLCLTKHYVMKTYGEVEI
jgi:hypothetical protein